MSTQPVRDPGFDDALGRVREILSGCTVAVLATASAGGVPATALVSWIVLRPDGRIGIAVDCRGTTYRNLRENPFASVELFDARGSLAVRGRAELQDRRVESTPFRCVAVALSIEDLRDHRLDAVALQPPRYAYVKRKSHYRDREAEIRDELRRPDS